MKDFFDDIITKGGLMNFKNQIIPKMILIRFICKKKSKTKKDFLTSLKLTTSMIIAQLLMELRTL